jgi:two-component system response regulator DesR
VAEVGRADAVVKAALSNQPDVALLDIEMPGGDGLSATLHIQLPLCRILI